MADDPRTELDRLIQDLQRMEQAEGFSTEAAGMLHAARTILLGDPAAKKALPPVAPAPSAGQGAAAPAKEPKYAY